MIAAGVAVSSCGGPYTGKKVNQPDAKLAIAEDLFERGKYREAGIEYKGFLATFAGDERSDYAQFRVAESLRLDEDYTMASVEYRILINDYGYSEYVDDSFYLDALCSFKQAPIAERDQTKSYEALSKVNRFLQVFPGSSRRDEALQLRREIHNRLGRKEFKNAKLYFSGKHFSAAKIYFEKVAREYQETVWAGMSYYYLGIINERWGEVEEAVEAYRGALSSKETFKEKRDAERRLRRLTSGAADDR